ncbi:MAG TPA: GDSL-type esterase/lipase family protein [Pseudolabrys sp.]|nr:GDSL-type esterase/lipase family protein [Pseudolabrys sp.]
MDSRIATTLTARCIAAALVSLGLMAGAARAQSPSPPADSAPASSVSKACQPGSVALAEESALPNVAVALATRKKLRILAFGAAPGRVTARGGGYTALIEQMLERALKGTDVTMVNRGVSGELAASAAVRMKTQVALEEPDLVLWQVGTNDALASVPSDEFALTIKDQIDWLKRHKVDVVLVGLQFANQMLRDAHYIEVRETLRRVAAQENVIVIRFFEAMQIINRVEARGGPAIEPDEVEQSDAGYNCLAQYVARAITLGVFAKNMPKRPAVQ